MSSTKQLVFKFFLQCFKRLHHQYGQFENHFHSFKVKKFNETETPLSVSRKYVLSGYIVTPVADVKIKDMRRHLH